MKYIAGRTTHSVTSAYRRILTLALLFAFCLNAVGCGTNTYAGPNSPPIDDTQSRGGAPTAQRTGMSTKQKVVVLAGAAALYYLYKKHQNPANGPQYYLSKNGRVYYRDAQHRAHWVTPPAQGIQVPESEAGDYREFQGYDNRPTGRDLSGLSNEAY